MGNANRKRDGRKTICFRIPRELISLLEVAQSFYSYSTMNKLMPFLVMSAALEIAGFKPGKDWTKKQLRAHKECKKFARSFAEALMLTAAERVLSKQPKGKKMSVPTLMKKAKKEIEHVAGRGKTNR